MSAVSGLTSNIDPSVYESRSLDAGSNDALDKNDFLQLLITQLQYQDPLNPMDNTQFIAQMAQFSSLEQMTNISTGIEQLGSQLHGGSDRNLATNYLGMEVWGFTDEGENVHGIVSGVGFDEANAPFLLMGDFAVPVNNVVQVTVPEAAVVGGTEEGSEETEVTEEAEDTTEEATESGGDEAAGEEASST